MILSAFALYDTKASYFGVPFFFHHRGQAVRAVIDLGSDMNTQVGRYPTDFVLYEIGSYDDQTGSLVTDRPQSLGPVSSFLPRQESPPLFRDLPKEAAQ